MSGQLGNGEIETYEEFQLINTGEIIVGQVSAAGRTSGFITEGGSMRMFGSNDTGQLGYGEDSISNPNYPIEVDLGRIYKTSQSLNTTLQQWFKVYSQMKGICTCGEIMNTGSWV